MIVIIAAIGMNNELGKNNKLIWHLPNDLKFFKDNTNGHPIVMGYNTFKSLPKLLCNRTHIVLTHRDLILPSKVIVFNDKEKLLKLLKQYEEDVFIIGGESIYKQFIENADKMLLTEIEAECKDADSFFPKFNKNDWECNFIKSNEENDIKYKHLEYVKRR